MAAISAGVTQRERHAEALLQRELSRKTGSSAGR